MSDYDTLSRNAITQAVAACDWVHANALIEARALRGYDTTGMHLHWPAGGTALNDDAQAVILRKIDQTGKELGLHA